MALNEPIYKRTVIEEINKYISDSNMVAMEELKKTLSVYASPECVICMSEEPSTILVKCGHVCLCSNVECKNVTKCPLCRQNILAKMNSAFFVEKLNVK